MGWKDRFRFLNLPVHTTVAYPVSTKDQRDVEKHSPPCTLPQPSLAVSLPRTTHHGTRLQPSPLSTVRRGGGGGEDQLRVCGRTSRLCVRECMTKAAGGTPYQGRHAERMVALVVKREGVVAEVVAFGRSLRVWSS